MVVFFHKSDEPIYILVMRYDTVVVLNLLFHVFLIYILYFM